MMNLVLKSRVASAAGRLVRRQRGTQPSLVRPAGSEAQAGDAPTTGSSGAQQEAAAQKPLEGGLYLVATPIGNLHDMSFRAISVLKGVSTILAEDTRRTKILLQHYGIATGATSYHAHNERERLQAIVQRLRGGEVRRTTMARRSTSACHPFVLQSMQCDFATSLRHHAGHRSRQRRRHAGHKRPRAAAGGGGGR